MISAPALDELTLPNLLVQDPSEVRALQDRLLRTTVELCYRGHPFYRKVMRERGLTPADIQGVEDLEQLPVTSKHDFLSDPAAFRVQLDDLPLEMQTIWEIVYTTGTTTGVPAPIYTTTFDHYAYMFNAARRTQFIDLRETDLIVNLFPLTPFPMGAYSRSAAEAAACKAAIVYAHPGRRGGSFPVHRSLDEAVRVIEAHRGTVLWGVAGFVRRALIRAREMGADLSSVRMAMITGEATSSAMRSDMKRRLLDLGSPAGDIVNRYGSTEQGSSMVECVEGSGFHNLAPDQIFMEVVDPASGRRLQDGDTGSLAFTHLIRRGTVFLRYAMGDVASLTNEICPHCGRTSSRISSQTVRSGSIVKIKGTLVNLKSLRDGLERIDGLVEYQIVVRRADLADEHSADELLVRMAATNATEDQVRAAVLERTIAMAHVRPTVEVVDRDEIYDPHTDSKPKRIIDQRG